MKAWFEKDFHGGKSKLERVALALAMGVGSVFMGWAAISKSGWQAIFAACLAALLGFTFFMYVCAYSKVIRFLIKLSMYMFLIFIFSQLPPAFKELALYVLLILGFLFFRGAIDQLFKRVSALEDKNG